MRILSLFSGIGAFEKALFNLGYPFEVVRAIEYDKYAIRSYNAIHGTDFPSTDIRDVIPEELPDFDFMTYGFPCSDISVAGKMKGIIEGETRSGLLFDAMKILKAKMPKFAIAENVKNLVGEQFRPDFVRWLIEMSNMGYNNYWEVLNSKDYGVPQNRERVFVVSIRKDLDPCKCMMGGFEFPLPIKSNIRLKDVLEKEVDEKYYISDKATQGLMRPMDRPHTPYMINNETEEICTIDCRVGALTHRSPYIESVIPYLTPDRAEKRQNGRRFKEDGDPSFTITSQDVHGVTIREAIKENNRNAKHQQDLLQHEDDIARCICQGTHGSTPHLTKTVVRVQEATTKGYAEATEGDSINIAFPDSKTRRGRVQKGLAGTLETSCNQAVIEKFDENKYRAGGVCAMDISTNREQEQRIWSEYGNSPCLTANNQDVLKVMNDYRIRKLTPKECFKLQGFSDEDFKKCRDAGISDSQLYKQAGNSITVNVPMAIFRELKEYCPELFGKEK